MTSLTPRRKQQTKMLPNKHKRLMLDALGLTSEKRREELATVNTQLAKLRSREALAENQLKTRPNNSKLKAEAANLQVTISEMEQKQNALYKASQKQKKKKR